MKKFLLPALAATLLLAATAVAAPLDAFKGMKGTLDIAGGTAHIPVMKEAAKRIMTANPDIRITVAGGGSGVGVQQVGEGLVQIGNTGRPLKDKEIEKFGLKTFPFAIDGVALVVNPANNVSDITAQQAAEEGLEVAQVHFLAQCDRANLLRRNVFRQLETQRIEILCIDLRISEFL